MIKNKISKIFDIKKSFFYVFLFLILSTISYTNALSGSNIKNGINTYKSGQNIENNFIIKILPLYNSIENGSGALFAGCENSINIDIKTKEIKEIHIELEYNIDDLSINKVLLSKSTPKTWYRVENNKIIYTQKNKSGQLLNLDGTIFSFIFQSKININKTNLTINPNSYIIDKKGKKIFYKKTIKELTFSKVGECNPDIIAPYIKLISPKESSTGNKTNTNIIIKITDNKAGVDRDNLDIILDSLHYKIGDENVKKDGNIITINPVLDLPYGKNIKLIITVQDKNKTKPNKIQQIFSFQTTKNTPMCKELGCNISLGRQITPKECIQFQKMFLYSNNIGKKTIKKLFKDLKLKCNFDNIEILEKIAKKDNIKLKKIETAKKVSFNIFSLLGWILFAISFVLKLWYIRQYKKLKKTKK